MRRLIMAACLAVGVHGAAAGEEIPLTSESKVVLTDAVAGSEFLRQSDAFTSKLSALERKMRIRSEAEVSEEEFLKFASEQALDWAPAEADRLRETIKNCRERLARWKLPLPATIPLLKTTGKEEGGAAYTRREGIVLSDAMLRGGGRGLEPLLLHELFHVLSRHNPALRKEMYAIIGFEPCGEGELLPELNERKVTNPDAPTYDYAISLDEGGGSGKFVPVIQAKTSDATVGFQIRQLEFLLMEVETDGQHWTAKLHDGKPRLLPISNAAYQTRIGRNTGYTIHAEEVLADNFSLLMRGETDVPSPKILEKLGAVLEKYAGSPVEIKKLNERR